jgi:hypothetical protein
VSARLRTDWLWERLTSFSDTYTCYSAAVATWVACEHDDWSRVVDPGLWLTVGERPDGLFAFAHFPPGLRAGLGLVRTGMDGAAPDAVAAVLQELGRSGRVIVAGDGFQLPWHVAFKRRHVPHWYVVLDAPEGPTVLDPFACRNELGLQEASRRVVGEDELEQLITGLPGDDPVLALREALALGDDAGLPARLRYQWYVRGAVGEQRAPAGAHGPDAVLLLASHFRADGQEPSAYGQADDLWSIARHRAFLCRYAQQRASTDGNEALANWVGEHAAPLAKKWGHIAPLVMQASLALSAGRAASASVPDTLEQLAELERSAAAAFTQNSFTI